MARLSINAYSLEDQVEDLSPEFPDCVTLNLADGRQRKQCVGEILGGPARPMGEHEIVEKYLNCGGTQKVVQRVMQADLSTAICLVDLLAEPALTL